MFCGTLWKRWPFFGKWKNVDNKTSKIKKLWICLKTSTFFEHKDWELDFGRLGNRLHFPIHIWRFQSRRFQNLKMSKTCWNDRIFTIPYINLANLCEIELEKDLRFKSQRFQSRRFQSQRFQSLKTSKMYWNNQIFTFSYKNLANLCKIEPEKEKKDRYLFSIVRMYVI